MISFKDHFLKNTHHQRASFSRALFSVVVTWSTDSPTQYLVVSSAYRNVVAVSTTFGRSLNK